MLFNSTKIFLFILLFAFCDNTIVFSQPSIKWQSAVGDSSDQRDNEQIVKVQDGYIIATGGDLFTVQGYEFDRFQLYKIDFSGNVIWSRKINPKGLSGLTFYITADGNNGVFYACSYIPKLNNPDDSMKTIIGRESGSGDSLWQVVVAGDRNTSPRALIKTADDGCMLAGSTNDVFLVKVSKKGEIEWSKNYGGSQNDVAQCVFQTKDNGYIFFANTASHNGIVHNPYSSDEPWIVKTDKNGKIIWNKVYGGSGYTVLTNAIILKDGDPLFICITRSSNGDVGTHIGSVDGWVVKLDTMGNIIWKKVIGGTNADDIYYASEKNNGDLLFFGQTSSNNGDVTHFHGKSDIWVSDLDSNGKVKWSRAYGTSNYEFGTLSNPYLNSTGYYFSTQLGPDRDGDLSQIVDTTKGNTWLVKLNDNGDIIWQKIVKPDASLMSLNPAADSTLLFMAFGSLSKAKGADIIVTKFCENIPDTVLIASNAYQICAGDSLKISAKNNYSGYKWSDGDTTKQTVIKNTGKYYVTVSDNNGCSFTSYPSVNVTVNSLPDTPAIKLKNDTLFTKSKNVIYQWYFNDTLINNADTNFVVPDKVGYYKVVVTNINGCSQTSLPFYFNVLASDLFGFTGKINAYNITLQWRTGESDLKYFTVQKSVDGNIFSDIGHVETDKSNNYQFIDYNPFSGRNYYRIESINADNVVLLSNVISIPFFSAINIKIFPNPVAGKLNIISNTYLHNAQIMLYSSDGVSIMHFNQDLNFITTIDISRLSKGSFFLVIKNEQYYKKLTFLKE